MPKPITPLVGTDVFVVDAESRVLLIKRSDNGYWVMPGGCQNLGETAAQCAVREVREESGFEVKLTRLLGIFSSQCYEYVNYPWKDNEFSHILFAGVIIGGEARTSHESLEVGFFPFTELPPLSDGHYPRIALGMEYLKNRSIDPVFE